jgi:uncharacterized membrane protein YeaQ/YmgE (transglycosylase-associated protein family)
MIGAMISWAVFGLLVGLFARLLYPGPQPMSLLMTMLLGIGGSLLGGMVSWALFGPPRGPFDGAGWILSIIGALVLVALNVSMSRRRLPRD